MTPLPVAIAGAIASLVLVLFVLELIRKRRLRERYAMLWLATGVVLLVLSLWRTGDPAIRCFASGPVKRWIGSSVRW